MGTWVILITDGTVIEYPPEAYETEEQARSEGQRWAWIISGMGWLPIEETSTDRWTIGDRDVRLVRADGEGEWVGTFWTWDGYPDPEATLLRDRTDAGAWVAAPLYDVLKPVALEENEWMIVATFERKGEEAYAVAHRLKRSGSVGVPRVMSPCSPNTIMCLHGRDGEACVVGMRLAQRPHPEHDAAANSVT